MVAAPLKSLKAPIIKKHHLVQLYYMDIYKKFNVKLKEML